MRAWRARGRTHLSLGTHGPRLFPRRLSLSGSEAKAHMHIIGVSGSGKSRFLASLYLSLIEMGLSATLIDPHGDLSTLVLSHLVARGYFDRPEAFEQLIYLDLPRAEREGRFLPFNVLSQPLPPHTVASNIKESMHRAWPALSGGAAPMFDTLVQDGVKVLISNHLPLTALYRLLTDRPFRTGLLKQEADEDIVAFFRDQFDRLSVRDQADQAGAALRRAHLLTFSPVLKYSLAQSENRLSFRHILDRGQSLIVNLALPDADARRLLGCLLTVMAEQGALSRADLPPSKRKGSHHLILDEFAEFTAQSEESLARILSLCRKYGLFLCMAHQTFSQTSERLRGALQNVGVEVAFRLGRTDAEHAACILSRVNVQAVKHEVADEAAIDRTHPVYWPIAEQTEQAVQRIQDLKPRHAVVRHPSGAVAWVKTEPVPDVEVAADRLAHIEEYYLSSFFRPQDEIDQVLTRQRRGDVVSLQRRGRISEDDR